jgi:hypothetical protein
VQQILTSPCQQGGGDAAPADSGADASVRLAGRTSSTRLKTKKCIFLLFYENFNMLSKILKNHDTFATDEKRKHSKLTKLALL